MRSWWSASGEGLPPEQKKSKAWGPEKSYKKTLAILFHPSSCTDSSCPSRPSGRETHKGVCGQVGPHQGLLCLTSLSGEKAVLSITAPVLWAPRECPLAPGSPIHISELGLLRIPTSKVSAPWRFLSPGVGNPTDRSSWAQRRIGAGVLCDLEQVTSSLWICFLCAWSFLCKTR